MGKLPKVLFVEDMKEWHLILGHYLNGEAELINAETIDEARRLFNENPDLKLIIMTACVPGSVVNTLELTREFRERFKGVMIGMSAIQKFADSLVASGCNFSICKVHITDNIQKILDVVRSP